MALQFRRGTQAELNSIVPVQGEPIWTTDSHRLSIGDGVTPGGVYITGGDFVSGNQALYTTSSVTFQTVTINSTGSINTNLIAPAPGYSTVAVSGDLLTSAVSNLGEPGQPWNGVYANYAVLAGLVYPITDGTAGQIITTDGAGNLSWKVDASGVQGDQAVFTTSSVEFQNITIQDTGVIYTSHGAYGVPDNTFTNARIGLYGDNPDYTIGVETNHSWIKGTAGVKLYSGDNAERLDASTTGVKINGAYTLPLADGTANQIIYTDGAGNLNWKVDSAGVQGDQAVYTTSSVTFDSLTVTNLIVAGTMTVIDVTTETVYILNVNTINFPDSSSQTTAFTGTGTLVSNAVSAQTADYANAFNTATLVATAVTALNGGVTSITAGTGTSVSATTGDITIWSSGGGGTGNVQGDQAVYTTSSVTFNVVTATQTQLATGIVTNSVSIQGQTGTSTLTVASYDTTYFDGSDHIIKIRDGANMYATRINLITDGTNIWSTEYAINANTATMGVFTSTLTGVQLDLTFTPAGANFLSVISENTLLPVVQIDPVNYDPFYAYNLYLGKSNYGGDVIGNVSFTGIVFDTTQHLFNNAGSWITDASHLNIGQNSTIDEIGTTDFTLDWWVYIDDLANQNPTANFLFLLGWDYSFEYRYDFSAGAFKFLSDANGQDPAPSSVQAQFGQWNHIAIERNGGDLNFYVNGVIAHQITAAGININHSAQWFNGFFNEAQDVTKGWLDYLRMTSIARYQGNNFIPPQNDAQYNPL